MSSQSFFFRADDRVVSPRKKIIIVIAVIVAIVLIVIQTGFGQSVLKAAGLSHPSEPFVELYFPSANALPSKVPASVPPGIDAARPGSVSPWPTLARQLTVSPGRCPRKRTRWRSS